MVFLVVTYARVYVFVKQALLVVVYGRGLDYEVRFTMTLLIHH
jgi:hypothetical protein